MSNQNKTISWQAPEFRAYEKTFSWYVILAILGVLSVAYFLFFQKDIFAAVCLTIIFLIIAFFSRQVPKIVEIQLNQKEILFGNLVYPYKQIKFFWVVNTPNHKTVNFLTSAFINNTLIVELENQDPEQVRIFLKSYLPEHAKGEETLGQQIMHRFKF